MKRAAWFVILLCVAAGVAQDPDEGTETTTNTTTTEIPGDAAAARRWPAAQLGKSFRIQTITLSRVAETIEITFRQGTGEGSSFTPAGVARTMTIELHDTCPIVPNCLTFLYNGPNADPSDLVRKRYFDRSMTRNVRRATREAFKQYTGMIPEYFQPDRMKVLP